MDQRQSLFKWISLSNYGFNLYAAVGVRWLNQESRGIFDQGKPKPQKLGSKAASNSLRFMGLPCPKI